MHKTNTKCSAMAIDQCHEHNNAMITGSGGAVGLTDNPPALRRWMVADPEVTPNLSMIPQDCEHHHHKQHPGVQAAFVSDVRFLSAVVEEMGSPFL